MRVRKRNVRLLLAAAAVLLCLYGIPRLLAPEYGLPGSGVRPGEIPSAGGTSGLGIAGEAPQSISEIAHLCGFREPLYLSRVFRKKYGLSPQQYQNRPRPRISEAPDSEAVKLLL